MTSQFSATNWDEHIHTLNEVFNRLQQNGFSINPKKCEWAVQETDFLGYYLTPNGIKPWSKKVRAILDLQPHKNIKQLRAFICLCNYYCHMWPKRSHVLKPLTNLTGKKKFIWEQEHQLAFQRMKAIVSTDCLL